MLGPVAAAVACPLPADFFKSLLVVRPHKLVEACWNGSCAELGGGLSGHGPRTRTFPREQ